MKQQQLISIILPVYNGGVYLAKAIQSCLNQTYSNFELIIVEDCSTDASFEIAMDFSKMDKRIKIIRNSINKKLPESLNIGHRVAVGEFLTWTSDDNLLKSNFLEVLHNKLKLNEADIVFSNYDIIRSDGSLKRTHLAGPVEHLLIGNTIGASFMYKKEVFKNLGGFRNDFFLVEDFDFWIRAMKRFRFLHVNQNLYSYRIHHNSLTSAIHSDGQENAKFTMAINKMYQDLGKDLRWNRETEELILDLHFNNSLGLSNYLKNRKSIEADLKKLSSLNLKFSELKLGIIKKLRFLIKENKELQRAKFLGWILFKDKSILFHRSFNLKETIKLIRIL